MRSPLIATALGLLVSFAAAPANATSIGFTAGSTTTSVNGAATFWDFSSVENTSIGTVTGGLSFVAGLNPVSSDPNNKWGVAFDNIPITVTFANPVTYVGFDWGSPDVPNTVEVWSGSTLLATYTGATQVNGTPISAAWPGAGYFDIFAGPGESIDKLVLSTSQRLSFEVDNFASPAAAVPGPVVGAGLPGLVMAFGGAMAWWRRRRTIATA